MIIKIEDEQKIRIAKWGANKLFGDPDKRKLEMSNDDLVKLFDKVWEQTLQRAVTTADTCNSQEAFARLSDREKSYFDFDQKHRQFRLKDHNIEFIVQLRATSEDNPELTQLWKVSSTDINPKTLYVTFDSVQEREQFGELANQLGWSDEDLGLQLLLDFMRKLSRRR